MTEISDSESNKQVDNWCPSPNTTAQQRNLYQVNTIGCSDDGLWIFSLEDSKKRRYTVNWEDQSRSTPTEKWKSEEHELMIDSGCFGHVCPPWFAPQFPMVSSINVNTVAANNVALQHYGQKVVYGHVMTNSGRRILIQIAFDVMNVRKPILNTSALKHRGVTIIFNHDYDRIIFPNETVNLVSHDCHSYLHITLTNGIPPRKAMVMVRENTANDVDEEVYDNDGAERHEAQEASAGDRRAIADADQAGQLDISGEAKTARALRTPEPPRRCCENGTQRDTCSIQRLVSNLCCESWTKFSAQTRCGEQDSGYTAEIPDRLHVHANSGREQNSAMYHIRGNAQWSGDQLHVRSESEDLTKEILRHLQVYSFLNPIIIQCDNEMSIIDVCRKVAHERNARTVLRFAPKTSHQSNGFVETVHGHIQGLARCYQTQIETNTGVQLSAVSPAIPFAIRYAGFVL